MIVIGIDPGLSGALACVQGDNLLCVVDMPVEKTGSTGNTKQRVAAAALAAELRAMRLRNGGEPVCAVVERVAATPQMGVSSAFAFGDSAGTLRGVLQALSIRIEYVTPVEWKRALRLSKDKAHARTLAAQRWPDSSALFARARDDGRAEAALIAAWGWDQFA